MKSLIVLFVVCVYYAWADEVPEECDKLGILMYQELGCKAEYENAQKCPSHFTCGEFKDDAESCNFQGRTYKKGETLDNDVTLKSCSVACFCNGGNQFTCAVLDCPEWLGVPINATCYRTYEFNKCCSTGSKCEPYDEVPKCEYEGTTYKEGQKFYPKDRCYTCICKDGFKGALEEPFCQRLNCGFEIKHARQVAENCAPIYLESKDCCPFGFACPTNDEVIASSKQDSAQKCKYGQKLLSVGDSFERQVDTYAGKKDAVCKCQVPPYVTCNAK